jgi:predicted transcriptional regulator
MNREKIAWMVSLVLIAMLAFQLPGTLARRDDEYAFVKTLIDLHRQIDSNYVDPVDQDKLQMGSINGMMGELDPYSIYVPPAKEKEFDNMLEGHFEGVGIELSQTESGDVQVVTPILDSPALKAGVRAGDIIVKVNGQDIKGKKIAEVQQIIKGPLHSAVKLTVRHLDGTEVELSMTREQINLPTVMGFRQYVDKHGAPAWDYWVSKIMDTLHPAGNASQYATIQKLLERLEDKGLVMRDRSLFVHTFTAAADRDELIGRRLRALADKLCGGSLAPIVSHLARNKGLNPQEIQALRELIDAPQSQLAKTRKPRERKG